MKIANVEFFHLNPRLCERYKGHEVRFAGIDTHTVFRVALDNGITGYGDGRDCANLYMIGEIGMRQESWIAAKSPLDDLGLNPV